MGDIVTVLMLMFYITGKKGGALASTIYSYMQHGDPYVKSLIKHILTMVAQPVYATLLRWIYDGELEDTHDEVCRGVNVKRLLSHLFCNIT